MVRSCYIGIDIGTSNSAACKVREDGTQEMIQTKGGGNLFASVVKFESGGKASLVPKSDGGFRNIQKHILEGNVVMYAKRVIGKKYSDERVQRSKRCCKAQVNEDANGYASFYIPAWNRLVSPEEVYTVIINAIWERVLVKVDGGKEIIKGVTFTVPADYRHEERMAIKRAIQDSNVNMPYRILNEPCAAAIAFGCNNTERNGVFAMYDLGGGTFDTALIQIEKGRNFSIIGVDGDSAIGGSYFDDCIVNYIRREKEKRGNMGNEFCDVDDGSDEKTKLRYNRILFQLTEVCREAKETLSSVDKAEIEMEKYQQFLDKELKNSGITLVDDEYVLTRETFNKIISKDIETTIEIMRRCIDDADVSEDEIKRILLVGGSSRIRLISKLLAKEFGDNVITETENPDEVVARGAALYAKEKELRDVNIEERVKWDICTQVKKGKTIRYDPLIRRGEMIPIKNRVKEYFVSENKMGYFRDVLAEGIVEDEKTMKVLKAFETDEARSEDGGDITILYSISITEEGILKMKIQEKGTGRMILDEMEVQTI